MTTSAVTAPAGNSPEDPCAVDRRRFRRETIWAWLSLAALIICWDASLRLDHRVPIPRPRLEHAVEREEENGQRIADDR